MIEPDGQDKTGVFFHVDKIHDYIYKAVLTEQFFERRNRTMSKDIDKATDLIDQSRKSLNIAINKLMETEKGVAESTKKVSGLVRATTQSLAQGIAKIEKQANFDRLERYVELLERANAAMSSLADLEKSGRLEKIAGAIR